MLADLERRRRGDRGSDHIHALESLLEIALDQRAHFLRLPVVGVVIAGGKGIGAQHDAPLDLRPEASAARAPEDIPERLGLGARAVADAVVARQVGGGLRRGDQVVHRQGVVGVRQADLRAASRPGFPAHRWLPARRLSTSGCSPPMKYSCGTPMRRPSEGAPGRAQIPGAPRHRQVDAGGIARVVPGDDGVDAGRHRRRHAPSTPTVSSEEPKATSP